MKAENGEGEEAETKAGHGCHLRPEDVHPHPFEVHAAQHDQKIAKRHEVGEVLQPLGHGGDGKPETGKRNGRHDEEECGDHGLLLRGRNG